MQNIRFENPEWLLLLLLLPVLLYSYVRAHRGRQSSVQFSDLGVLRRATASLWTKLRHGLLRLEDTRLGLPHRGHGPPASRARGAGNIGRGHRHHADLRHLVGAWS